jgi:hypothetical protein
MKFHASGSYSDLLEKARWSHGNGRSIFHIKPEDVQLARLFSHGYRTQTIGAFHSCRVALETYAKDAIPTYRRALWLLEQLECAALMPVPTDFRALVSTLYSYDANIQELLREMETACVGGGKPSLEVIMDRFIAHIEKITGSSGICPANDTVIPEQCGYVVPGLGITILPLSYGNHLSWNVAYLPAEGFGVSPHKHDQGVEIHLGFSPTHGRTLLGNCWAQIEEGYAMPIASKTQHGFENLSGHHHILPFIFGSLSLSGWGVFFDVEPQPYDASSKTSALLDSAEMNHSVYLDQEILRAARRTTTQREILIPASATRAPGVGGLDLWISSVGPDGLEMTSQGDRLLSVRQGSATIQIGAARAELAAHDHVCIPAGLEARIQPRESSCLVVLDTNLS